MYVSEEISGVKILIEATPNQQEPPSPKKRLLLIEHEWILLFI